MREDDGTHVVISARILDIAGRYVFIGFLAICAGIGASVERRISAPTHGDYAVVAQQQEEMRRELDRIKGQLIECQRACSNDNAGKELPAGWRRPTFDGRF